MEPNDTIAIVLVILFGITFVLACTCYQFAARDVRRLESQRTHQTRVRMAGTHSNAPSTEHGGRSAGGVGAASNAMSA